MIPPTTDIIGQTMARAAAQSKPVDLMSGFSDIHHHIIYGVDDGPQTLEEAKAMLALAYKDGIRRLIATPHFDPVRFCPDVGLLKARLAELQAVCDAEHPGLQLSLGAEVLFGEGIRRKLLSGAIPTLAGGDHVLVEFVPSVTQDTLEQAVRHLANGGYVTVIAHMERYPALLRHRAFASHLKDKYGARLQVNAGTILTRQRFAVRRFLRHALGEGLVDFVASDAHGAHHRRTRMGEAFQKTADAHGLETAGLLFRDNAARLLSVRQP